MQDIVMKLYRGIQSVVQSMGNMLMGIVAVVIPSQDGL